MIRVKSPADGNRQRAPRGQKRLSIMARGAEGVRGKGKGGNAGLTFDPLDARKGYEDSRGASDAGRLKQLAP